MDRVAFAVHKYLGLSETFIYGPLYNFKSFEPVVLTLSKENLDKFPFPQIFSISDLAPRQRILENLTNYFGRFSFFKKIIKDLEIKLIHAQFAWDGIFMLPLKRHSKLPLVTTFRGLDIYGFGNNLVYRLQLKKLFCRGDLFLAVSNKIAEKAISLGCPENKIRVLYGGIDIEKFKPATASKQEKKEATILMCGRFVEKKGFEYAIKAFAQSKKTHKNIRLRIMGDGPLKDNLIKLVKNLGIEKSVTFEGNKDLAAVAQAMQQADIFMMSFVIARDGSQEGIPNVLKEAQASGLPTLSTYHAGVPEVVLNGNTGFLVKEKDITSLSQKLDLLIENPSLRLEFGAKGRKWIDQEFNLVKQTRKLEEIYRALMNKHEQT